MHFQHNNTGILLSHSEKNMKISKIFFCSIALCFTKGSCDAQQRAVDPLSSFKKFYEFGIGFSQTRVNTNFTEFTSNQEAYTFRKNSYASGIEAGFNFGWLIKEKNNVSIWNVKSGLHVQTRSAELSNQDGTALRLSTAYLQVPLIFGFQSPLKNNAIASKHFKAFEFSGGLYAASPLIQKLDKIENIDSPGKRVAFNYVRFGYVGEIAFTAFNNKGEGHKFGIRASSDFTTRISFRETNSPLYPYYINVGLFYMLSNRYK